MKILWISWKDITHPDAGGAEQSGEQHAIAWRKAGHSVHWVSTSYKGSINRTTKNGISYEHIGAKALWYTGVIHILVAVKYITKWNKEFDLVIDEIHGPPFLTPLYASKKSIAVIHEVAGDIWKKTVPFPISWCAQYIIEPLFFSVYRSTPFIIGAETTKDDLLKFGIPEKNINFIPYGVTTPENKSDIPKENRPTLIFLSSIRPVKGLDRVHKAFKEIKKHIPDLQLWIVGDDTLPYAKTLKEDILKDEWAKDVHFFGKVSQEKKFELLKRAHLLVHGSYKEGWGLVVIEANAVGVPAIVFDAAGLRNSVQDGVTGYIAKNQIEFVHHVTKVLGDIEAYNTLSENAITWSKEFSWQKATVKSVALIESII